MSGSTVPLGNVVAIDREQRLWNGRPYVGLEDIEGGTGRLLGDRLITSVKSTSFGFDDRHVLYGRLRPYLNKVLLPDFAGHCSTEIFPLHPAMNLDRRYLWYWLTSSVTVDAINATCTGARMPRANMERVLDFEIPLPPLDEQLRIVAVLDEAFAAIATATANAEKNLANARELLQSATVARMHGSDGWQESTLGSFCSIYQPETISRKQMSDDGDYVVFGANGPIGRYDRFNHEEPELLVTCRGATCGSINMSEPFSWITGNAMVVRPKNGKLRLSLLRRIFETAFDFSRVITGSAQPQITRQSLAPAKISFPSDLAEQNKLDAEIAEIDAECSALRLSYEARIKDFIKLKQSMLAQAFAGGAREAEPLAA